MTSSSTKRSRSYRPLRRRIERHAKVLSDVGMRILEGSDSGWFGDGGYLLANDTQLLRITRWRGEEALEIAWTKNPTEEQWFDIAQLMVAFNVITFEDAVANYALPRDLDFMIPAYLKLYPVIDKELRENRMALNERLDGVRRRGREYAQEKYGRPARS